MPLLATLRTFLLVAVAAAAALFPLAAAAQGTASGQLVEVTQGPYEAGDVFEVELRLRADPGAQGVGTSSIVVDFDGAVTSFPASPSEGAAGAYEFSRYQGQQASHAGGLAAYSSSVVRTNSNRLTVNVDLGYTSDGNGQALPDQFVDAVTLRFQVAQAADSPTVAFETVQLFNGPGNLYTNGTFEFVPNVPVTPPTVTLTIDPASVVESGTGPTLTATLSESVTENVNVSLSYSGVAPNGAQAAGVDYGAGSITILSGETTGSLTVILVDDDLVEGDETAAVEIGSVSGGEAVEEGEQRVTFTILDDDVATLAVTATNGAEDDTDGSFRVTSDRAVSVDVEVSLSVGGTATLGSDYTALPSSVFLPAGDTSVDVLLEVLADDLVEGDETVVLTLGSTDNGRVSAAAAPGNEASATITDDDVAVVSVAATTQGAEGGADGAFTVSIDQALGEDVDVTFALSGTATEGSDFATIGTTATIPAGETSVAVAVDVTDDAVVEGDETVVLTLQSVTAGTASVGASDEATVTIADDDVATLTVGATNGAEDEADGSFTVTSDRAVATDVVVTVSAGGTATAGTDYAALPGTITLPAGQTSVDVVVDMTDDAVVEGDETVVLTLGATDNGRVTAAAAPGNEATSTIADNDTAALTVVAFAGAAEDETDGAFRITASNVSDEDVEVTVAVGGTATPGTDYTALPATVTLPAGQTSVDVAVEVLADDLAEGDETVVLTLESTDAAAVTVGDPASASVTITDDDTAGIVVSPTQIAVSETATTGTFTVTLTQAPTSDVTVAISSGDEGEATVSTALLTFTPAGALEQFVTVTGVDDVFDDGDQVTTVTLAAAESTDPEFDGVDPADVAVTTTDDDSPPSVTLAVGEASIAEGASTTLTATLSGAVTTTAPVTVQLAFAGGAGQFTSPDEIVIPAGETSASVTFTATADGVDEVDAVVVVTVEAVSDNAVESGEQSVTVTIEDDDPTLVSLSASPLTIREGGGPSTITATLTTPVSSPVTVGLAFSTDDAGSADYQASGADIVIPAGAISGAVTLTAVDDSADEGDEAVTVSIASVIGGDAEDGTQEDGDQGVTLTIQDAAAVPTVAFAVGQQDVSEGGGSVDLVLELSAPLEEAAVVDVTLTSGDPSDLRGFEEARVRIAAGRSRVTVRVSITDDVIAEDDETFVFALSVVDGTLELGSPSQTRVVIADDDGDRVPASASVPARDGDGDGIEDGGPLVFTLPIDGATAGDVAAAAGADEVFVFDPATGGFVAAPSDLVLAAGQAVLVDVAPGAELAFDGSAPIGDASFPTATVVVDGEGAEGRRVLVALGNPTGGRLDLSSVMVTGGVLADVALVFDEASGSFRPVSLAALDGAVLGAFGVVVLQVVPDPGTCDDDCDGVAVSVPAGVPAASGPATMGAPFEPTNGETAVVLVLRPSAPGGANGTAAARVAGDAPGDTFVLRLLDGAEAGLDPFDGLDVRSPLGGTLAATGLDDSPSGPLVAALAQGIADEVRAPLAVSVPAPGTYEIALAADPADVDQRPVTVELLDGATATVLTVGAPVSFAVADTALVRGRFTLRVTLGTGVATESEVSEVAVGLVFPNPASASASVEVTVDRAQRVQVVVHDLLGRVVLIAHDGDLVGGTPVQVALRTGDASLAPGTYVVRVAGETFATTRRLTVIR